MPRCLEIRTSIDLRNSTRSIPGKRRSCRILPRRTAIWAIRRRAEAWHDYAMLESLDFDTAVMAEATSQLLDYEASRKTVGLVKLTLNVSDANALQEKLLSSKVIVSSPMDPAETAHDDAPPPKAVFQLIDRPMPRSDAELTLDMMPRILCQMLLYRQGNGS